MCCGLTDSDVCPAGCMTATCAPMRKSATRSLLAQQLQAALLHSRRPQHPQASIQTTPSQWCHMLHQHHHQPAQDRKSTVMRMRMTPLHPRSACPQPAHQQCTSTLPCRCSPPCSHTCRACTLSMSPVATTRHQSTTSLSTCQEVVACTWLLAVPGSRHSSSSVEAA